MRIVLDDKKMQLGLSKCAVLIMKRRRMLRTEGIITPNRNAVKSLDERTTYKYLDVFGSR